MTKLLVSVRSADEARAALAGGADLIDVKEPRNGALGAADEQVQREIIQTIHGRAPCSLALGELLGGKLTFPTDVPFAFAKIGLAGCGRLETWPVRWREAWRALPRETTRVAVAYADWETCAAPAPDEILKHAAQCDCRVLLLDTFDKSAGNLFTHWNSPSLSRFIDSIHHAEMLAVLAGSLTLNDFPAALALSPDYLAVRGAACVGERQGDIKQHRVRALANSLAG